MTGQILVTGGTGTLGRALVRRLVDQGRPVRVLSRRPPPAGRGPVGWATGNLRTGRGIDAAVAGLDVIVHCATGLGDVGAARHLIESARRARSPQVVYISIVGVDRIPIGYYKSKLEVERLVENSGLPWTVLRATQFHQLIVRGCQALARLPVMLVPACIAFQPVDAREVAGGWPGSRPGPPPGGCRTWAVPRSATPPNSPAATCKLSGGTARFSPSASRGPHSPDTAAAGTWPPITRPARSPSRSSSPNGSERADHGRPGRATLADRPGSRVRPSDPAQAQKEPWPNDGVISAPAPARQSSWSE